MNIMNIRIARALMRIVLIIAVFTLVLVSPCHRVHAEPPAASIPARPEQIVFAPLAFEPPDAAGFRRVLPDGTVVYLAPSHEFPLVNLVVTFKGGASLDPIEMPGLASMTARMVREGGTATMGPTELDESLDFLATDISVAASDTFTAATMNCLASNFDESLKLFVAMLRTPAFDEKRLETSRARVLESLKQRNDDASSILGREWKRLLYGTDHFEATEPTDQTVAAISRDRLAEMHRRIFHPGNMIVSVSGDFDEKEMLANLQKAFSGWERGAPWPIPWRPRPSCSPVSIMCRRTFPRARW